MGGKEAECTVNRMRVFVCVNSASRKRIRYYSRSGMAGSPPTVGITLSPGSHTSRLWDSTQSECYPWDSTQIEYFPIKHRQGIADELASRTSAIR
jgi:hypothetical protein